MWWLVMRRYVCLYEQIQVAYTAKCNWSRIMDSPSHLSINIWKVLPRNPFDVFYKIEPIGTEVDA